MLNVLISNTLAFVILTYFCNTILSKRSQIGLYQFTAFCAIVLVLTMLTQSNINDYTAVVTILAYFVYILICYCVKIHKAVLVTITFWLISAISEIFSASFMNLMVDLSLSNIHSFYFTLAILLSDVFAFLFILVLTNVMKLIQWKEFNEFSILIFILPISTLLLLFNINNYFELLRNESLLLFILIGLLLSNFIIFKAIYDAIKSEEAEKKLKKVNNEKNMIKAKCDLINSQYNQNYSFIHNTVRDFMKLENKINANNFTNFYDSLHELNKKMLRNLSIVSSSSTVINPILNYRLSDINQNKISFKTDLKYVDFSFLDINTQRKLFNHLLDIAIDSCASVLQEERIIILKTNQIQGKVILQILFTHSEKNNYGSSDLLFEINKLLEGYTFISSFRKESDDESIDNITIIFKSYVKH